jgi:hypothetical protein
MGRIADLAQGNFILNSMTCSGPRPVASPPARCDPVGIRRGHRMRMLEKLTDALTCRGPECRTMSDTAGDFVARNAVEISGKAYT